MERKKVDLNDIDANFVIASFKNKERRNNPSSEPRPLYPPGKDPRQKDDKAISEIADKSNEPDTAGSATIGSESDTTNSIGSSDKAIISEEASTFSDSTKRTTLRQRKIAFEEYCDMFLITPKIKNRKPVFISEELRERLDEIARKLGDKGMSASGFIENMALQHLKLHEENIEHWRRL